MKPIGATTRCQLSIRAYRMLLERQRVARGRPQTGSERMDKLADKLVAMLTRFSPAERAYYDDQTRLLDDRARR